MRHIKAITAALFAFAVAGFVLAQNATYNSAGPTKNDYRLRIVQPLEGAKIVGSEIEVVVDTEIPAERDQPTDANSMPRPAVAIYLDGERRDTLRDANNAATLQDVALGPHTLLFVALNKSNEVIDRKEVRVLMVAPQPKPKPVVARPAPPPPPAAVPPPPPPPAPAPVVAEPLPKTATADPLLVLIGLAAVGAGLLVRRMV